MMMMIPGVRQVRGAMMAASMVALAAGAGACGEAGHLEMKAGELDLSGCLSVAPNKTFTGGASPAFTTRSGSYGTASCPGHVVIDIYSYSSTYLGNGTVPGGTYISWLDASPTTSSACQTAAVEAAIFERQGSSWSYLGTSAGYGEWVAISGLTPYCLPPEASFIGATTPAQSGDQFPVLQAGKTYRLVYQARQGTFSGPTRRVSIESRRPVIIH